MSDSPPLTIMFDDEGLIPAVVQDAVTGDVLMLASMNDEALRLTHATGQAHYFSRSRQRLWRKGETSGHTQTVDEIRVNCERNSLLLLVRQAGAVCHDGYPTCYYRRVAADGTLTVVRERAFDPAEVYDVPPRSESGEPSAEIDRLAEATRRQYGAYAYLRDHDLTAESSTSRRLRDGDEDFTGRIADELRELAGVLDGGHRHTDRLSDLRLEASQVIYWILLHVLREGVSWTRLRPDRALAAGDDRFSEAVLARLLRADADRWTASVSPGVDTAAAAHATLNLVGQACLSGGLDSLTAVESDLKDLQARSYLAGYFGSIDRSKQREPGAKRAANR